MRSTTTVSPTRAAPKAWPAEVADTIALVGTATVTSAESLVPEPLATTTADPGATALTVPDAAPIVATPGLRVCHVTLPPTGLPERSTIWPLSVTVSPTRASRVLFKLDTIYPISPV